MNIKLDTSFFELKAKPSLLHPLTLEVKPQSSVKNTSEPEWDFRYLSEFSHINQTINSIRSHAKQLINNLSANQDKINPDSKISPSQVPQLLQQSKDLLQKCEFFSITHSSSDILIDEFGLLNFYKYPDSFKTCTLLTEIQRTLKAIEQTKDVLDIEKRFPWIGILQKVTIRQILPVLKSLKENIYIPSNQNFLNLVEKLRFAYDENLSLKENMLRNSYNLSESQSFAIYYQLLIYRECSSLEGLCHFLSYTKNILLDRKSGALAAEHQTWVAIFEACLKLYARNPQVRQSSWLEVDQILSTTFLDEEFNNFLLTSKVEEFSLASLNFYLKNLNKTDQQKLLTVAQEKIMFLFSSGQAWKEAEDIVEHLDSECQGDRKEKIFNKIIKLIDSIFLNDETSSKSQTEIIDIEMGLTFFIESMCKYLQISQKIFNKTNLNLIISTLKKVEKNQVQIRLLYHIFTEFIINSYQESDELSSYLEANQEIVVEILPEIITLFNSNNYTLPKELYKLIFHSVSDIELLDTKIWRGIAELYFLQCFEQSIDMEIFHTQNEAKQKIADQIVQILKELTLNNGKENIFLSKSFKQSSSNQKDLGTFMYFKAFKDEVIFNNCLMMSTFFGEYLSLTELSGILSEFYSPILPDIKWKTSENQSLTLLSFIAEELPIDVLKATYKFLKQGFRINIKHFESLSTTFWSTYFSSQQHAKVIAIANQPQFSYQTYQSLQAFRLLDLVLSMINCVFDKLNEQSQKSIKELKVMYEWGVEYIEELQPHIYLILMDCVVDQFEKYARQLDQESVQIFELYSRTKNISILDLHVYEKYHIFQTFNDFNRIGQVIGHEKTSEMTILIYPCFIKRTKLQNLIQPQVFSERTMLKSIFKLLVLIENSCLEEVMNDDNLSKVSKKHTENQRYYEKVILLIEKFKHRLATQSSQTLAKFMQQPFYKRLISHLKLLMGKIYIPFMIKQAFSQNDEQGTETSIRKLKNLDYNFTIIKSFVEVIHKFDPSFEEHFAELMQVIEENSQNEDKKSLKEGQIINVRPHILIKTLEMFFRCVLSNIKVRSFHIFKLIKLYLNQTNTQLQSINQVIKFYIELLFSQFIQVKEGHSFNEEVKEKSKPVINSNEISRCKILTPHKSKEHISFADKVLSPLKREKISLQELKLKKMAKSSVFTPQKDKQNSSSKPQQSHHNSHESSFTQQDELPQQVKKLIIKEHHLTTVQCSCTLSMFINLFARLNYSSLPTGIQQMLARENDKIVYLDYLVELTDRLLKKDPSVVISQRDLEILSIDVYGNLSCILKGRLNEEVFKKFINLAKMTLKLDLADQTVITLPIKLLNQRLFAKPQAKKLTSQQPSANQLTHISKFIEEFEEEPLAYELSVKSHIMKISPYVKSNIHLCNLEYIVGENKSSISKKIIQTNYKLIENVMGRVHAKEFLKKYEKSHIIKESLNITISHQAIDEMDKILNKFASLYEKIDFKSETQTIQLYFYFKKICSILFYAPELFSYLLAKQLTVNNKEMTLIDIIFDTLKSTLVFFCEFYIICLKINSGFCTKNEMISVIKEVQCSDDQSLEDKFFNLPEKIPLNFVFEVYIKLRLLNVVKKQNEQNSLRALNFAIKQSEKFRFRFYKFIKIHVPQSEDFLKKLDEQILESLLKDLKESSNQSSSQQSFVNKIQMMDLCLENLLSHTMFDYAKMKLDNKLKDTFVNSQYSIKCLQSFNCDIKTLKVLEEAEEEKSVSSGSGYEANDSEDLESDGVSEDLMEEGQIKCEETKEKENPKENIFANFEVVKSITQKSLGFQSLQSKFNTDTFHMIEFTSQLEPFSVKQTSQLKQWLQLTTTTSQSHQFTSTLLKEMQKSCQKLIGKENLSFTFDEPVYLEPSHNTGQIDLTAFSINEPSNTESDCCIEDTSFCEEHNDGMIIEQEDEEVGQADNTHIGEPQYDEICEDELNCDGIIEEEEDQIDEHNESVQSEENNIKISIVEQTHVNRFQTYQNQDGDAIIQLQDPSDQQQQQQQSTQQLNTGTDGSIQFTPSIKSLQSIDELQLEQVSQQIPSQSIPAAQCPQICINSQPRQYHYTIDNFTAEPSHNRLSQNNNNNSSLVDTISQEIVESNQPVTKESIFSLIEEYTLNPEIFKVIKLKLKKISNSQLKKVHGITHGDLKDQVQREMRTRGLYVAVAPGQYQSANQGSLFSISRLINQSFQIDQSKFYSANYKKCDKKTAEKQKIQKTPELSFGEWVNFVFMYLVKSKEQQLKDKIVTETLLEGKNLSELLIKLLLNKENLVRFLEVLLNLLSCEKVEQTVEFFQSHIKLPENIHEQSEIFKSLPSIILNELIAKLITNRIGLPVLFKGKWNYETKTLIKYEFQCLISDSNLNNNRSQGEPLLEVFLRKSIELIYSQQSLPQSDEKKLIQIQTLVKSLTEYFRSVENFQSNQYPYYFIQDTIKLTSHKKSHNGDTLSVGYQPKPLNTNSKSKITLCQTLLSTMKASSLESLKQYEEVFYLMNYLDFETFSEFLQLLIQKHKPLCEKVIQKQLNIVKRFKKSAYTQNLNKQKLAQIYWHMRKSSKSFLSTDQEEKQLEFFARLMSCFSSTIFLKFKQSIFKFGYGKEETKKKEKISYLNKLLMNPAYEHKFKSIKEEIAELEREYLTWKLAKSTEILREDVLPIIEKIAASFNQCLKKWELLFEQLEQVFGTQREERFILYKQCSEFYKIFLSLEMLMQSEETSLIRTMSSLKTKPSLQSTRDMGITGRRRSSLKLPRVSLASSLQLSVPQITTPTFKSVFKSISPKFSFFSHMIDPTCPELKIHAKYSTIDSKLKLLHQANKGGEVTIEVRRDHIWQDTLPFLNEEIADKSVKIKIAEELGLDYGGIRREWITLIVKELLNPNLGLFELSVNGLAFQPSELSYLVPNHLFYFYKLGILVGKALKQNWLLEINFTKSFLKHLLGYTLYVEDLEDIDPNTTKSLLWILNNDIGDGDLGIDFTHSYEVLGKKHTIELIENGKETLVTEENKKDYVKLLAVHKMTQQIRQQSKTFMNGLEKVVPYETLKLFSYKELGIYLAGMPTVDVQEMKKYTRYQGFSQGDQTIKWFWETLATYTEEEKANFLFFLTGSYKVPYGGFKENPISINKMPASTDYLPVAHTCFSVIDLPEYSSKEKLAMLLDKALKEGKGFSVS